MDSPDGWREFRQLLKTNVGGSGLEKILTIRNTGNADLQLGAITLEGTQSGDFQLSSPANLTIAPGGATTLTLRFLPAGSGPRTASLHIFSNAEGLKSPFDLTLTGEGNTKPNFDGYVIPTLKNQPAAVAIADVLGAANPGHRPLHAQSEAAVRHAAVFA